jgi:acyl carrier protein
MTEADIFAKVQNTLVDALAVDEQDVTKEATLQGDLGAESIDFLDIVFRLEKNFGIKIPRGELFPDEKMFSEPFVEGGKFTAAGLDELRRRMPYADVDAFAKTPEVAKLHDLYTVDTLVRYIAGKIA